MSVALVGRDLRYGMNFMVKLTFEDASVSRTRRRAELC
jgi:hypothetical protein